MLGLVADRLAVKSPPTKVKKAHVEKKSVYFLPKGNFKHLSNISIQDYNFWMNPMVPPFVLYLFHAQIIQEHPAPAKAKFQSRSIYI